MLRVVVMLWVVEAGVLVLAMVVVVVGTLEVSVVVRNHWRAADLGVDQRGIYQGHISIHC